MSSSTTTDRRSAGYKPNIWNLDFLKSLKRDYSADQQDDYENVVKRLKCEVKNLMVNEELKPLMVFKIIDEIQRLGLGNHFGEDIESALRRLTCKFGDLKLDLHATALGFRLLRQNGIFMSQDVFKQFMDENGNFKPSLCNDNEGMKSLYEASHLGFEGEHLSDEAKAFTKEHLTNRYKLEDKQTIDDDDDVNHTLGLPLRCRMPKLEARHYIETHPNDDETALLELAMLDYNMAQLTHQQDLQELARWWKDLELSEKLSFARDRLMECFFWGIGTLPKPELSSGRKALTKVFKFITIIDDIYDVYGTIDELELFTNAIERWNINAIDELPDYMKLTFLALYNTVNEIGYEILKQKGFNCIPYLKKTWEDMIKAFLVEAKWLQNNQIPTFEEYLNNGWVSVSGVVALTHVFFFVSPEITPEALHCLRNNHDILRLPSMVFRLSNDLATSEAEIERGETANAISCYAKEEGVTMKDARKHLSKLIDESWKNLNEIQVLNETPFSVDFIEAAMNLARTAQCAYQHGDGHGSPELIKKKIVSLIVDPIQL
ncbi:tricyclene synthase EBOS, chloroplastic-like [Chenopodium quinoa]|uniref:tricyclene synthase EBOS, chloroplastic-like n=1 Tax=Chenopodium quinoa TaxID=63459 RepID=UPI000B76DECB|nr:tricyclene synthase EBOS, chloroplastic-like [Chenopodium quinoa]